MMYRKTVQTTVSRARSRAGFTLAASCAALLLLGYSAAPGQTPDEATDTPPEAKEAKNKPAKAPAKPTAKTHPNDPMIWDIEQMMEDAVMQLARRYNLNGQQEDYTRLLLKTRVREFLKDYEGDVRELLQESIKMRLGQASSDSAALQQWADRAKPLYEAAMSAILEGNSEWGQILDEDQKKIHDGDLKLMRSNATAVNKTLDDWSDGKGKLPAIASAQNSSARTVANKGEAGKVSDGGRQSSNPLIEGNWTAYVNTFIKVYQLTEKQQNAARNSILKDQLARARKFRETNKKKFAKIETDLREPMPNLPPPARQNRRKALLNRKRDLQKPIRALFVELDRRLNGQLDSTQRAGADPIQVEALKAQYDQLAKEPVVKLKPEKTNVKIKPDAEAGAKAEKTPSSKPTTSPAAKRASAVKEPAKPTTPTSKPVAP